MSYELRPHFSTILRAGSYHFQMEDVELIYKLYVHAQWTLYKIKKRLFENATVRQIAVAVDHGRMDQEKVPYFQRPTFCYDPDVILLSEFRVGHPAH